MEPLIVYLKNTTNTTNGLSFSHFFNKLAHFTTWCNRGSRPILAEKAVVKGGMLA
jgi:hypothetical protein